MKFKIEKITRGGEPITLEALLKGKSSEEEKKPIASAEIPEEKAPAEKAPEEVSDTVQADEKTADGQAEFILEYYDEQLVACAAREAAPKWWEKIPFLRKRGGRIAAVCTCCALALILSYACAACIIGEKNGISPGGGAVGACEHSFKTEPGEKVTCTRGGTGREVCSKCGFVKGEVDMEALGHDYVKSGDEATCEKAGRVTYTCSRCGDTYSENQPKLEHDFEVTDTRTTCDVGGDVTSVCKRCGHTETEHIAAGYHNWLRQTNRAATCTEDGESRLTCLVCGAHSTERIPATGHTYTEAITKEATCTAQGEKTLTCSTCADTITQALPATGHSFGSATCTTPAACTVCGLSSGTTAAHKYVNGVCTVCGKADPSAHTPTEPPTEPSTEPSTEPIEPEPQPTEPAPEPTDPDGPPLGNP